MRTRILAEMQAVAPPGPGELTPDTIQRLLALTQTLLDHDRSDAYERFLQLADRGLPLPHGDLRHLFAGKTVLVTGGTGCVGSALLEHLRGYAAYGASALISVSRGQTRAHRHVHGVRYRHADVGDEAALKRLFEAEKPQIVFHLAGQRNPSLAEEDVATTLAVNVLGTRNVVQAAAHAGACQVVFASSTRARQPVPHDVYGATKKVGEWLLAGATAPTASVRLPHLVDNSLLHARLRTWMREGRPIRLHAPDTRVLAGSARESAHLLLAAVLAARPRTSRVLALRNPGEPLSVVDLALGAMRQTGTTVPLHFCGYEPGYFPGATDGALHPLEEDGLSRLDSCPEVEAFVPVAVDLRDEFRRLEASPTREALHDLCWTLLERTLESTPPERMPTVLHPDRERLEAALQRARQSQRAS